MTPDEIRAEVERRKQRAKDLRIPEVLWALEQSRKSQLNLEKVVAAVSLNQ
jgi:hypothetical protein